MKTTKLLIFGLLISCLVMVLCTDRALAQAPYPNKPIKVLVGMAPGGIVDVNARFLSSIAEKSLRQPIIIENKPGASGAAAIGELIRAKPDGYTIGFIQYTSLTLSPHIMKVNYSFRDLTPIIGACTGSQGLCVRADFPVNTYKEFVEYVKKHPGLVYGHSGKGGTSYITMLYLIKKEGLEMRDLPFPGGPASIAALLGGHIDFLSGAGSHWPFVRDGKFKLLLSYSQERMEAFPNVPSLGEIGAIAFPGSSPIGCFAPKGIPGNVRKTLEKAFTEAVKFKGYREFLEKEYWSLAYYSGADAEKLLQYHYTKMGAIIKDLGVSLK